MLNKPSRLCSSSLDRSKEEPSDVYLMFKYSRYSYSFMFPLTAPRAPLCDCTSVHHLHICISMDSLCVFVFQAYMLKLHSIICVMIPPNLPSGHHFQKVAQHQFKKFSSLSRQSQLNSRNIQLCLTAYTSL